MAQSCACHIRRKMAARANRQRAYTGIDYGLNRDAVSIGLGEVLWVDLTYELRARPLEWPLFALTGPLMSTLGGRRSIATMDAAFGRSAEIRLQTRRSDRKDRGEVVRGGHCFGDPALPMPLRVRPSSYS